MPPSHRDARVRYNSSNHNMRRFFLSSRKAFTLVEMIVVTTIFAIMSVVIIQVYIQTTLLSQKLHMSRLLADSGRELTERIATDVREYGVNTVFDTALSHPAWTTNRYTSDGNAILSIR